MDGNRNRHIATSGALNVLFAIIEETACATRMAFQKRLQKGLTLLPFCLNLSLLS